MSNLRVSVGDAARFSGLLVLAELLDAGAQRHQRVVDVSGLAKTVSGVSRPVGLINCFRVKLKFESAT